MNSLYLYLRRVSLLLLFLLCAQSFAQRFTQSTPPMSPTVVQTKLSKRGIGKKVRIIEIDGSVVNGVIDSIDAASFQVTPKDATHPALIRYAQVAWVKKTGLSTKGKAVIAAGAAGAGVIAYVAISR